MALVWTPVSVPRGRSPGPWPPPRVLAARFGFEETAKLPRVAAAPCAPPGDTPAIRAVSSPTARRRSCRSPLVTSVGQRRTPGGGRSPLSSLFSFSDAEFWDICVRPRCAWRHRCALGGRRRRPAAPSPSSEPARPPMLFIPIDVVYSNSAPRILSQDCTFLITDRRILPNPRS